MLPKIRRLILRKLPKLKGFYSKVHTTDWPFSGEYINFRETQGESQPIISVHQPLFWVTKETFPNYKNWFRLGMAI
ncbi:hypothetical protein ES332_D11G314100v1 [Gossypium tomentosum]|uniref:Uncharacterized protein n=1 Tax=Gossypium tomentosum TaxID=34277 RepID=A0A5D2IW53_GOSTO|nr:hypothetical protein ES332_D11G314100v1 [Gossypium tomentosum]